MRTSREKDHAMLTVARILALDALIISIVHAMGKAPLWPAVLLLAMIDLLHSVPLGR
jgi:hypothetical protein